MLKSAEKNKLEHGATIAKGALGGGVVGGVGGSLAGHGIQRLIQKHLSKRREHLSKRRAADGVTRLLARKSFNPHVGKGLGGLLGMLAGIAAGGVSGHNAYKAHREVKEASAVSALSKYATSLTMKQIRGVIPAPYASVAENVPESALGISPDALPGAVAGEASLLKQKERLFMEALKKRMLRR
jgi:hypothetical protein